MTRALMQPIKQGVRAYFAPVHRDDSTPAVFDPAAHGRFNLDAPPAPWLDLGWVENLNRSSATKMERVRAGVMGAPAVQFRTDADARVEFEFREWGKLQMALAAGSQHMNCLATQPGAAVRGSGGAPIPATTLLAGSTATELKMPADSLSQFAGGDLVAVDLDYQQQAGYVGSGIAAAYVRDPMDVMQHPDYVRRVTFNVGRVTEVTATSLKLAQPLLGGDPQNGAAAQKVIAFVDREGGAFFQEWSALFVMPVISGGRVCLYYPRLQTGGAAGESRIELSQPIEATALHASFTAMPVLDANDGEQVLCYRSYFPASGAELY